MGQGSSIGNNCRVMNYGRLGQFVTMGSNNRMNPYAGVEENAQIDSDCIMGMYSTVGSSAKLERNVYAGDYCRIGSNSVIGQNSIIQPYAMIPDDGLVSANEMIIKTPTTAELYKNSLPVDQISQSDVKLANHSQPEELNERVRQLVSTQKRNVATSCQQNGNNVDFKPMILVISLYLIRYDGLDQFIKNKEQNFPVTGSSYSFDRINIHISGELIINGKKVSNSLQSNADEKHFVEGAPKKLLETELENEMVELLALKEDSQRQDRLPGDTFCKTFADIQSKQRKVKCDQSVDIINNSQGGMKSGESHPPSPTNSNGSQDTSSNQQSRRNQLPADPQHTSGGYETNYVPTTTKPNHSPSMPYPNQPNNKESVPRREANYGYPNNTPERSNRQPVSPPVNEANGHRISHPTTENNQYTTRNGGPGRTPNISNGNYPNVQQNPSYPNPGAAFNNNRNGYPNKASTPMEPVNSARNPPECNQCTITPDTNFGHNVELGSNLNIGENTTVGNNCKINDNAVIGRDVKMCDASIVYENANIGSHCVLDDRSKVGRNANIGPGTYVGKDCEIGDNAFIGDNSIILDNATVPANGYVGSNQMVMRTPTSADLYSSCAPVEELSQNLTSSQQDPNNNLRQMMRGQVEQVRSYCQKSRKLLDFADLAVAKTIYLITLHGTPSFMNNRRNVKNRLNGNDNYDSASYDKLTNEEHFIQSGQPSRIEVDVKGEMIVLLAIEQDFGRENRLPGGSFCQTFMDIASNQRQVKCDKQ